MDDIVNTAKPIIENLGIFLPHCSEVQIDSVDENTLTLKQKNALKCERNRLLAQQSSG